MSAWHELWRAENKESQPVSQQRSSPVAGAGIAARVTHIIVVRIAELTKVWSKFKLVAVGESASKCQAQ